MICKFCGNTIEDKSDFCFICGQKVAQEPAAEAAPEQTFTQVTAAPEAPAAAPAAEQAIPAAAPIYAQQAPIYAQQAPVYAQQAYVQQIPVGAVPVAPVAPAAAPAPKAKKEKKAKDPSVASKACKFFAALFAATFILQFIPWIWVKNAKKNGYEEKATAITNATMVGLCIFMGIICVLLIKKFML